MSKKQPNPVGGHYTTLDGAKNHVRGVVDGHLVIRSWSRRRQRWQYDVRSSTALWVEDTYPGGITHATAAVRAWLDWNTAKMEAAP